MIDIRCEKLIPLHDVAKLLPPKRSGKRISISAIYRWVQRGVRKGTRLEVVRIGGTSYTSEEALQRFASATPASAQQHPTRAARQRQIDAAVRRLDELL